MKLIFVRHAKTEENIAGLIQGHLPGTISQEGKCQTRNLASWLRGEKLDCIYSSDLERCVYTTNEIASFHPAVRIEFTSELRERNVGVFQGLLKSKIPDWEKIVYDPGYRMPEGETIEEVYARISKFLARTLRADFHKTVLVVGHGFSGRVLISILQRTSKESLADVTRIRNGELIYFDLGEHAQDQPVVVRMERFRVSSRNIR